MSNDTTVETSQAPTLAAGPSTTARSTASEEAPRIAVTGLSKRFHRLGGEEVLAVDDISISVGAGEFLVLLGPSGCGKTTLLRCLAGLEHPEDGRIEIDGRTVYDSADATELPPERRRISMMFQSYALWPHMTVYQNVVYPLESRGAGKGEGGGRRARKSRQRERVEAVLERVHCGNLLDQYPGSISGGQQQRIALARALVADDRVVLFDEPLSNVDAKVREELRFELLELQRKIGFSAVYVTHDQAEAMALADRIALLRDGKVEQVGTPDEVYHRPATEHVARFLGSVNELAGVATANAGGTAVQTPIGTIAAAASVSVAEGARAIAAWRPEASVLSTDRPDGPNAFRGTVKAALFLGSHREYALDVDGVMLRVWRMEGAPVQEGSEAWLSIDPADVMLFPAGAERP